MVSLFERVIGVLTLPSVIIYLFIFFVSWAVYRLFIYTLVSPLRMLPTRPRANILFGNMREIFALEAIDPYVKWITEMNSSIIRYYHLLGAERVVIADADAMKHIMVTNGKNYIKPKFLFSIFTRVTGDGLISLNGKEHLTQRKFCLGAFKIAVIKNMLPSFQKHTSSLINVWKKQLENGEKVLEVHHALHMLTLDIICECGFGYSSEALSNPDKPETKSLTSIISSFRPSFLRIIVPILALNIPTKENTSFKANLKRSDNMIHNIITNKKCNLAKQKETKEDNCTDLLTMLLLARDVESGEGLSDSQIRDHVMTFLLAGHETTSSGISWFLLMMAENPEIQKKLHEEIISVLPTQDEQITWEEIEQLTYLNCCVKETLRLYPPAPMTFRECVADDNFNGFFFPKGTIFNIHVGAMQRNPKYWTDPEKYNPERFLDERNIHPYSYLPFIAGTRMCIGYKFALLEMKVVLAMLLREFHFEKIPDTTYIKKQTITMKPNPSLQLQATIINHRQLL